MFIRGCVHLSPVGFTAPFSSCSCSKNTSPIILTHGNKQKQKKNKTKSFFGSDPLFICTSHLFIITPKPISAFMLMCLFLCTTQLWYHLMSYFPTAQPHASKCINDVWFSASPLAQIYLRQLYMIWCISLEPRNPSDRTSEAVQRENKCTNRADLCCCKVWLLFKVTRYFGYTGHPQRCSGYVTLCSVTNWIMLRRRCRSAAQIHLAGHRQTHEVRPRFRTAAAYLTFHPVTSSISVRRVGPEVALEESSRDLVVVKVPHTLIAN